MISRFTGMLGNAAAIAAAFAAMSQAVAAPTPPVVSTVNGMEVRLDLDRTEIAVGEPLFVRLKVTNKGAPVRVANFGAKLFYPEGNDVQIMIQRPGELPVRYNGVEVPGIYTNTEMNIDINKWIHQEFLVLYDKDQPNGYVFSKPGDYVVSVRLTYVIMRDYERQIIDVPSTKIRVVEPSGEDAEAFKMISNSACARSIHASVAQSEEVLGTLRKVADRYPKSRYAPLCLFAASATLIRGAGSMDEAIVQLRKFLERYPTHQRTSSAIFDIAMCYQQMKKADVGRDWFYYLMDHDPGFHLLRDENPTAHYYYFGVEMAQTNRRWWLYEKPWDVEPARSRQ